MENLAFICHANEDAIIANKVVAELEKAGINCWIAPRNIPLGSVYAASIVQGIKKSSYIIFIFSKASNNSDAVVNEIENATALKKPIITFRIDNDEYSDSLYYYLSSKQSVSAYNRSLEHAVAEMIPSIKGPVNKEEVLPPPPAPPSIPVQALPDTVPSKPGYKKWLIPGGIALVAVIVLVVILTNRRHRSPGSGGTDPDIGSVTTKDGTEPDSSSVLTQEETKSETPSVTMHYLEGTWKLEWGPDLQAAETVLIDAKGDYYVNGEYSFSITDFDYDKNSNLMKFNKKAVKDPRILQNTLSVKSENLLEGTEATYDVRYTRMSAPPPPPK